MEVRDPIHGTIALNPAETAVADHRWVQRLRQIGQMGFSRLSFPGATHTRFLHSIGVMHLAGLAFDYAYRDWAFDRPDARSRFRECVRIAALCHDLGHAPMSHALEFSMPPLSELGVTWYRSAATRDRRASHEDYTIAILEHTALAECIATNTACTSRHVAALVSNDVRVTDGFFHDNGLDHRRLLSQIVSSELDVDRLDYLVRDAVYTGTRYGQVDAHWLLSNLTAWTADGQVCLAFDARAVYAFDHFLLARHHMFLMVYFHHRSVIYEEMLRRYIQSPDCTWQLSGDLDAYLQVDDVALMHHLRCVDNPWARRIAHGEPYQRVVERHGTPREADLTAEEAQLRDAGVDVIAATSTGVLSRYESVGQKRQSAPVIYVVHRLGGGSEARVSRLSEASEVFARYADVRRISRLYVAPADVAPAKRVLGLSDQR